MSETTKTPSRLKIDLTAFCVLGLVIFLALSLFTHDPADPIPESAIPLHHGRGAVFPPHEQAKNACGRAGAIAADLLFTQFGLGAYYFVISLALFDVALLRRRVPEMPAARALGWFASLLGVTTMLQLTAPPAPGVPIIGPGGYLGVIGKSALEEHFAAAGSMILASSVTAGGLIVCTDYALFALVGKILSLLLWLTPFRRRTAAAPVAAPMAKRKKSELSVKVRGKTLSDLDVPDDEDEDLAPAAKRKLAKAKAVEPVEEEEDEFEDEAPIVADKKSAKTEPESALKVKNPLDRRKEIADRARREVISQLNAAGEMPKSEQAYELPSIDLLSRSEDIDYEAQASEVRRKAKILEKTFLDFGFKVKVVEIETGPVIAQYEVELEAGLRLSKITSLADDLAIALRVPSVRIVAPIPGKNTVGIEVPNEQRQLVKLREVIEESDAKVKKMKIPIFLGKDVSGNPLVVDLASLPHLLIAGRTGTGKSVCLNAIITSLLMTRKPDEVRLLMIDPKMVELSGYGRLPHLMHPVVTDMRKAEAILAWAVEKMEERYALLARAGVRHLTSYNQLGEEELMDRLQPENDEEREAIPRHLPFIVIVADEIADLMMTAGKEVEQHIIRLAQKSRAVGIHLILATQKPTVDVITGLIKSNLPARIAFQVASRTDSRVVLDEMGADKLLSNGDMLFLWPGTSALLRGQGTYIPDEEINAIVDCCSKGEQNFVHELMNIKVKDPEDEKGGKGGGGDRKKDEMYAEAVEVVIREGRGSVSLLQRSLGIGYGRAARLIDFMAEDGVVGAYAGSNAREVLMTLEEFQESRGGEEEAKPAPKKKRNNKVALEDNDESDFGAPRTAHVPVTKVIAADDDEPIEEEEEPFDEE